MLRCWSLAIVLDLLGPALSGVQDYPVNRPITVYAGTFILMKNKIIYRILSSGQLTPNLSCIVGFVRELVI